MLWKEEKIETLQKKETKNNKKIDIAVLMACRHYSPPNPGFFGWIWSLEWCGALGARWQKMRFIAMGRNLIKKSHNQVQVRIHAL